MMKTINELFSGLREKRQKEFYGIQNSFALGGIWPTVVEKYSEKAHFVYEVLQNADDVGATWAKFELYQDCLVFRHNGTKHFNITPSESENEDYKQGKLGAVNAITATSKSTKTVNSIGKFGMGFKAVFRYTKTPRIYDKDIRFFIHDYIVPEGLSEDFPGRNEETVFVFPFDREPTTDAVYVVPDKATCYAEIKNRLEKLKMPTLFLSTLSKVKFVCKNGSSQDGSSGDVSSGVYSVQKDPTKQWQFNTDGNRPQTSVMVLQNKKTLNGAEAFNDNLVMFSRGEVSSERYCLCFKLDETGKIAPLNGFDAFCFFPTQHHTGLPFLVHAPFQLNDAREMLCEDSEYNRTLGDNLKNLFADSFVYLERIWKITNHRYYDDGLLDLLPLHRNETQPVKEFESFFINESANPAILKPDHPVLRAFQTESVLPTDDGYTAKAHANFAETAWIIDAFPTTALRILLDDENADWAFPSTRKDKSGSADKGKSSFVEQTVCRTNAETRLMSELMKLNPKWASALDQIIKRDKETVGDVGTGRDATVETGRAVNQDEGLDPAEVEIDRHQWPLGTGPDVRGPFDRIPQGTVSWVSEVEPFIKGDVTIAGTQIRRAKLRIPPYQRRFAWKEHDVRLLCRDLLKTNGSGHYHLGTIILHRNEAGVEEIWDVVDGQQRLTNIMAILKAPVFDSNLTENGTIRIKQFSRRDYEMVKSVLEEYGESDKETIKNRLKSCTLAFVAVKDIAEAFQLFGTQNGRGKPLTPVNLLKAYHYREMNADFEQWKKERKNKVTGDTTEEQLKKDFDREVRFNIEKSWESANGEDASTASCDGKLLSHVFGEYLFRIRNWNHGKFPTESFGNRDIGEFKGVTIRPKEDQNWQLPLQNCAVLRKEVKTTEDSFIARRGREPAGFMPFMSICQTIVNGEDFFHYAETYATAYKHVFKENTVPEFSEFYTTNCSPSQHNKGGAMYARHIFEALCLFCYDLFGGEGLKACYQALFCCAYFERVSQARVLYRKCGATFAPRAIEVMSRNFTIEDVRQGLNDLASEAKNEIRKSGYLENLDQSQLTAGQKMQKAACKIIFG